MLPTITWLMRAGAIPERSSTALPTVAPRSVAGTSLSAPPNVPIAVRSGVETTMSSALLPKPIVRHLHQECSDDLGRFHRPVEHMKRPGHVPTTSSAQGSTVASMRACTSTVTGAFRFGRHHPLRLRATDTGLMGQAGQAHRPVPPKGQRVIVLHPPSRRVFTRPRPRPLASNGAASRLAIDQIGPRSAGPK